MRQAKMRALELLSESRRIPGLYVWETSDMAYYSLTKEFKEGSFARARSVVYASFFNDVAELAYFPEGERPIRRVVRNFTVGFGGSGPTYLAYTLEHLFGEKIESLVNAFYTSALPFIKKSELDKFRGAKIITANVVQLLIANDGEEIICVARLPADAQSVEILFSVSAKT